MVMSKFKEGSVIQLKSGGPKMTVSEITPTGEHYRCQWFTGSKLEEGYFPEEALIIPKKEKPAKKVN